MKQAKRKDGTELSKQDMDEIRALRTREVRDEDICKEHGISLATLADIAYGRCG